MKLTLYSFFGGLLVLIALIPTCLSAGSFDLQILYTDFFPVSFQVWAFPVMFLGFGVLAAIWPLHTWAPTGHSAAPTAGSMLLAGVVMKLGAYGALRVAMNLFPDGFDAWRGGIAILAIIGICYAAAVALKQRDLKFVIGYSSVSHMGFVLLGLATANRLGVGGAVLQMFSHGIIAGLLFAVAGRMIYERTHTRDLEQLSAMKLSRVLPFAAFTFVVACAASMGIPLFSGFAAEITILIGLWRANPALVPIVGVGMVLTAAFTLRALRLSFFGDKTPTIPLECGPITPAEKVGACLLMIATVGVGVYPQLLLSRILPAVDAMHILNR
jgi:NADH-quinone oxidoreductase subunit M